MIWRRFNSQESTFWICRPNNLWRFALPLIINICYPVMWIPSLIYGLLFIIIYLRLIFYKTLLSLCPLLRIINSFCQHFNTKEKLIYGIIISASYYQIDKNSNLSFMLELIIVKKILEQNSKEDKNQKFNIKILKYKHLIMLLMIF